MTAAQTPNEILEARARQLARPADRGAGAAVGVEMLGFTIGRERYAVESRFVFAVVQLSDLVPLPGARAPVVGLTRWRGDVLTVLDLRRVVGGVPGALDDLGRVIVLGQSSPEFGVLADILDGLLMIDPTSVHPLRADTSNAVHVLDASVLIAHQAGAAQQPAPVVQPSTSVSQ
jgi:purine-binding chemotaxis protein CheW